MAVNASQLVNRVKSELRITGAHDDPRIALLIEEAVFSLQQFIEKTLVDEVEDADAELALSPLHVRYVVIYVALQYDGDTGLDAALGNVLEQVRSK
jgi:hypothetical protein